MPKPKAELTEAEQTITKAVRENEPRTAPGSKRKVQRVTGWAYSTVKRPVDWSGLRCEGRFWEGKWGLAKLHYLLWFPSLAHPHI